MKRLLIFLLVGPFVGTVVALLPWMAMVTPYYFVKMLPFAYALGAVPALLACGVDIVLSDRLGEFKRAAVVAVVGYLCLVVVAVDNVVADFVGDWWRAGFAGAISGALCSLMSGEKQNRRAG